MLMRRAVLMTPLLVLAPLGNFLGFYLGGAGILPETSGFFVGAASMFLLPWVVAALFLTVRVSWPLRVSLFVGALVGQWVLCFTVSPAGAASEMMGIAHRLRREFPPDQMRLCAAGLCQKHREGNLVVKPPKEHFFLMSGQAVVVDDAELPVQLRGRFAGVFIEPSDTGELAVYFAIDGRTGILCDHRKEIQESLICSMAEGVHAYRYLRP